MKIKYKIDVNLLALYENLILYDYYKFEDKKINKMLKDLKKYLYKIMYSNATFEKDIKDSYLYHIFELEE